MDEEDFKPEDLLKPPDAVGWDEWSFTKPQPTTSRDPDLCQSYFERQPEANLAPEMIEHFSKALDAAFLLMSSFLGHGNYPPDNWSAPNIDDLPPPSDSPPSSGQGAKLPKQGPKLSGGAANLYEPSGGEE